MVRWITKNRAVAIGAAGTILITVGQVLTGTLSPDAAIPIILGAAIHPFVQPADRIGI